MMIKKIIISFGWGGTAFFIASIIGFEIFGGDFPSVFFVHPIALFVAVIGGIMTHHFLSPTSSRTLQSTAGGIATFPYIYLLLWFVRYAIPSTRDILSFDLIAMISIAAVVLVGILFFLNYPVLTSDEE